MNIVSLLLLCIFHVLVSFGMQEPQEITLDQLPYLIDVLPVEMWARIIALKFEKYGGVPQIKNNQAVPAQPLSIQKLTKGPNKTSLVLNNLGYKKIGNDFEYELKILQPHHDLFYRFVTREQHFPWVMLGLHPLKNKFFVFRDNNILSYRVNKPDKCGLVSLNKKHTIAIDSGTVQLAHNFMLYDLAHKRDNAFIAATVPSKSNDVLLVSIQKENKIVTTHNLLTQTAVKKACGGRIDEVGVTTKVTHVEFLLAKPSLFLLELLFSVPKTNEDNQSDSLLYKPSATSEKITKTLLCKRVAHEVEIVQAYNDTVSWDQPDDYQRQCSTDKTPARRLLSLQDPVDCALIFVDYHKKKHECVIDAAHTSKQNYCLKSFVFTQLRKM